MKYFLFFNLFLKREILFIKRQKFPSRNGVNGRLKFINSAYTYTGTMIDHILVSTSYNLYVQVNNVS